VTRGGPAPPLRHALATQRRHHHDRWLGAAAAAGAGAAPAPPGDGSNAAAAAVAAAAAAASARPRPPPPLPPRPSSGGAHLSRAPATPLARFLASAGESLVTLWRFLRSSAALLPQFSAPAPAEALRRLGLVLAASLAMVAAVSAVDGAWLSLYLARAAARA